jgi:hypothetical protein
MSWEESDSGSEMDWEGDDSLGSPIAQSKPLKKPAVPSKAAPKPAAKKKMPLGEQNLNLLEDEDEDEAPVPKKAAPVSSKAKKTIEEEYKKMDPREHVLLRPDMYIGAVTKTSETMWVYEPIKGPFLFVLFVFKKIYFKYFVVVHTHEP